MRHLVHALVLLATTAGALAAEVPLRRGLLVYPDGNRLTGRLVAEGVFASDRFGEIRFSAKDAQFEADHAMPGDDTSGGLKERVEAEVEAAAQPAPANVPAAVKPDLPRWHPWKFSISGFADSTTDDGRRRREYYGGLRIERPSESDPLVFDSRFEYRRTGDRFDKRRATGTIDWRHKFTDSRWFTLYRPYFEYDGRTLSADDAATFGRARLDYFFTQQQAGVGYNLLSTPKLKSNVILNWNHFHVWVFHVGNLGRGVPSLQFENTLPLGHGLELKQSGQLYWLYESNTEKLLWENHLDLTQRFGPHLFFTLRHEYRKDHPLRDATPLDRLRLLFGVNF
jgi:hypothetical protein